MAIEIERKFLVRGDAWRQGAPGLSYRQGYLSTDPERVVRIRVVGDRGWLTIKGKNEGVRRLEFEYSIPKNEAEQLLELCQRPLIEKRRYRRRVGEHIWEIDEFDGDNQGLVVAEIELNAADEAFERPPWLGDEVSDDPRYYNANLIETPYSRW